MVYSCRDVFDLYVNVVPTYHQDNLVSIMFETDFLFLFFWQKYIFIPTCYKLLVALCNLRESYIVRNVPLLSSLPIKWSLRLIEKNGMNLPRKVEIWQNTIFPFLCRNYLNWQPCTTTIVCTWRTTVSPLANNFKTVYQDSWTVRLPRLLIWCQFWERVALTVSWNRL